MSIAILTTPANAISSLSDLVTEIRDEMDDDGFDLSRIYRAIARSEAVFNRDLRCPRMETEAQFTTSSEATELPTDFLQLRSVYVEGSPDNPLTSMSPAGLRQLYRGRSGTPCAYALENRRIVLGPVGTAVLTLLYYARVPSLTEANPVNWLLDESPDLYLHQALAILFNKTGDMERAALHLGIASDLIASINAAGKKNRWGAGPLAPQTIAQVRSARL